MKMTPQVTGLDTGELVEDELLFSVADLCHNCSLQRELGVNLAGAALALELLDRIAALERQEHPWKTK